MSSLEKEVGAKQEAIRQCENQLAEVQGKYEACPKPEVVERYVHGRVLSMHTESYQWTPAAQGVLLTCFLIPSCCHSF